MSNIPEKDWKYLRKIQNDLLNKACNKIFFEIDSLLKERKANDHGTYLRLWDILRKKDRELSEMFDDLKRSNALLKITNMLDYGVLTEEQLMNFSNSTREKVHGLFELRKEL